jgi:hypothetical protein
MSDTDQPKSEEPQPKPAETGASSELSTEHFKALDRLWVRLFGMPVSAEAEYIQRRNSIHESDRDHVLYDMSIIDNKSSALLTHVSVMLAVVAVLLSESDGIWSLLLTAELIAFSFVGLILLRCLAIMGPPRRRVPADDRLVMIYRSEVLLRRTIYQRMRQMVVWLTGALVVLLCVKSVVV